MYLVSATFASFEWHKSCYVICYVTTIAAPGSNVKKIKIKKKNIRPTTNHMNHLVAWNKQKKAKGKGWKAQAYLSMAASRSFRGADSLCSLSIFTTCQQAQVPWSCNDKQTSFSLAVTKMLRNHNIWLQCWQNRKCPAKVEEIMSL